MNNKLIIYGLKEKDIKILKKTLEKVAKLDFYTDNRDSKKSKKSIHKKAA